VSIGTALASSFTLEEQFFKKIDRKKTSVTTNRANVPFVFAGYVFSPCEHAVLEIV
jgi:hypothetical protein